VARYRLAHRKRGKGIKPASRLSGGSYIAGRIEKLADNPRPSGCKKLRGGANEWRIRIGDYRVVYTIEDNTKTVDVTRIAHRKEAYKWRRMQEALWLGVPPRRVQKPAAALTRDEWRNDSSKSP
jgi:mRNA interferase RelE/StbE